MEPMETQSVKKGSNLIWVIIVLILIIGAVVYATSANKPHDDTMMKDDAMMDDKMAGDEMMKDDAMMKDAMEGDNSSGSYEAYAPEKLSKANNGKVVIFFHASWCPTCRALDSEINSDLKDIPDGVTILKADYDSETVLRQKYGVTTQHTLVQVDANGNMINKWSGGDFETLISNLK